MRLKRQLVMTGVSWLALLLFMCAFQPDRLPVVVLIVPFVLLFVVFIQTWLLVQMLVRGYSPNGRSAGNPKRLGVTVCGSLVLLLVLQSLGQLTLRDVGTVVAIAVIGYLYVARSRRQSGKP